MSRVRALFSLSTLTAIEAGLIGVFFIQALRFLVGGLYAGVSGASTVLTLDALRAADPLLTLPATAPDPAAVQSEIALAAYVLVLPLLAALLPRARVLVLVGLIVAAVGRALINLDSPLSATSAAAITVGGGLLYLAAAARHRAWAVPVFLLVGLGGDGVLRAVGNTLDPSLSAGYVQAQLALSAAAIAAGLFTWARGRRKADEQAAPTSGILTFTGGIGVGAFLFVELALLATPNAIAGRADGDYTLLAPVVTAATLLPLVPWVQSRLRGFIGLFDGGVRGWLWMLIVVLLLVFGTRFTGPGAALALCVAQFAVASAVWWFVRPAGERERGAGGLWLIVGVLVFGLLAVMDVFTFEYAYVRDFTGDLTFLNNIVTPLMRGFRGLGLAVLLLAVFFALLPMTQVRRRIPWAGAAPGTGLRSALVFLGAAAATAGTAAAAQPPVIFATTGVDQLRIATFNIHGGSDEFFTPSLEAIATTIQQSGANVVLVQEAEAGRLTSFGVDQPLWLARRLGMDRRFFATNEGLHGLAVLSNVPIAFDDGALLSSIGLQTGLQRVQILPSPDTVVTLYNTWLGYLLDTGGVTLSEQEQDQIRQLNEIFALIAADHPDGVLGRTVLGGTFNNVPDSPLIAEMRRAGFSDPFAGLPLELSATLVRTGIPAARFDYLWLRNLSAVGAIVIDNGASDHGMAVAGVQLNRTP
jgi:endonuclease/exonuclease/phosphatase family metal-dependent hydrolase